MASNLECLGLAVSSEDEFKSLVAAAVERAVPITTIGDEQILRWQDPSGVRMVFTTSRRGISRMTPSFAGDPGTVLTDVRAVNDDVVVADVAPDGEMLTRLSIELEEFPLLGKGTFTGPTSVVALGTEVTLHDDAEAFGTSDASILGGASSRPDEPRPPHVDENMAWPHRLGAESFIADGMFGPDAGVTATAILAGTVLRAERRTVNLTSQDFVVARVRTVGFEADVCLPASATTLPQPGNVLAGDVFLVGSLQIDIRHFTPHPKRRWFTRSR